MAIVSELKSRGKRQLHLLAKAGNGRYAAITDAQGKREVYDVQPAPADFGIALTFRKVADGTIYHVNLDGAVVTCDCPGGCYKGACKHGDAAQVLLQRKAL